MVRYRRGAFLGVWVVLDFQWGDIVIPVTKYTGLSFGIFLRSRDSAHERALTIDLTDGYIVESPSFTHGDTLILVLRVERGASFLLSTGRSKKKMDKSKYCRAIRLTWGHPPKMWEINPFRFKIPVEKSGGQPLATVSYPQNKFFVVVGEVSDLHLIEMGIVAQQGNFFFRSSEFRAQDIEMQLHERIDVYRRLGLLGVRVESESETDVLPPLDAHVATEDALPDLEPTEEAFGVVYSYHEFEGEGIVWLEPPNPDDRSVPARVRWEEIRGDDRFRFLKSGWTIAYRDKEALPMEEGKPEWDLKDVRIVLREDNDLLMDREPSE